jgi:hypothetical protein
MKFVLDISILTLQLTSIKSFSLMQVPVVCLG